ncbi:hypothetical protein [Acidiphilium iwatense]|uniref:Uncharacterized protein n=1 Tax=Acidiphilium iwatense TaxID=768198 RepID=A0ABS9DW13_9PROT|nr:hypothetical protein [Acidiphilium iwatense]MCF3945970.1 hypothetical protein [Acidiphilium iwatense]
MESFWLLVSGRIGSVIHRAYRPSVCPGGNRPAQSHGVRWLRHGRRARAPPVFLDVSFEFNRLTKDIAIKLVNSIRGIGVSIASNSDNPINFPQAISRLAQIRPLIALLHHPASVRHPCSKQEWSPPHHGNPPGNP